MRVFLIAVATLSLWGCSGRPPPAEPFRATEVNGAAFGQDFRLPDQNGRMRTLSDFRGKVVLLTFGYTHCPDVCPTTLGSLAAATRRLGADAAGVQVLFATLDPARDTPALLARYLAMFDPRFLGLSGDAAETAAAARAFRVVYSRHELDSGAGYTLDHSAGTYAFDAQGRLRLFIAYGAAADDIVHDLRLLRR